jgi:hypothetical protein
MLERFVKVAQQSGFIIRDGDGHALAYVYFGDEPGRRAAAKLLTRDEARRMTVNFAKLPEVATPRRPCRGRWCVLHTRTRTQLTGPSPLFDHY